MPEEPTGSDMRVPDSLAALIRVIHAPARLETLAALGTLELGVTDLADRVQIGVTTMSHHLHRLLEAGLVECRADRAQRLFRLSKLVVTEDRGEKVLVTFKIAVPPVTLALVRRPPLARRA